ncbi:hypothetical protein JCM33374_g3498 [Metschnikowia sp. JCM 33374]|nr:hypothetical protein JCM33374_g3498 [Metschnikowia sp. JCM 33374]
MSFWLLRAPASHIGMRTRLNPAMRMFGSSLSRCSDGVHPASAYPPPRPAETGTKETQTGSGKIEYPGGPQVDEKSGFAATPDYDDAKLREIIETSNMSAARQTERQLREQQNLREQQKKFQKQQEEAQEQSHTSIDPVTTKTPAVDAVQKETVSKNAPKDTPGVIETPVKTKLESGAFDAEKAPEKGPSPAAVSEKSKSLDLKHVQENISHKLHQQQARFGEWASNKWADLHFSLKTLAQTLNEVTGYAGIEKHKVMVENVEHEIEQAREAVKTAKSDYERAIQNRSDSQKEINELLTRKHTWTPVDVERFTQLYKNDHRNQQDETTSKQALDEAEQNVEAVQIKLTASILTRYHEEQLWSDKIRQASTWGTWMLMGVNIMLFATATFFVEPWKRRKLVNAFQEEVQQKLEEYSTELKSLSRRISPELAIETAPVSANMSDSESLNHRISFFGINSWTTLRSWATRFIAAVQAPGNISFSMEKPDFAVFSGILVAFGWLFGSLVNFVISSR